MKKWRPLIKGDLIDVVAPGSGTRTDELMAACEVLKGWGYRVRVSDPLFSGHPYLSHADAFRFRELRRALLAQDSRAVWCLRGGYGSLRLIPDLLQMTAPKNNKLFIGYSDITSLHLFLNQKWKWITCHGPLLDSLGKCKYADEDVTELKQVLEGSLRHLDFSGLLPINRSAERVREVEGSLMGGNLMVLTSHLGTALPISQVKNKIVYLEETGERAYRLDRMLEQLKQGLRWSGVGAVVLGDFLGGNETTGLNYVQETIQAWSVEMNQLKVPVFQGLSIGHGQKNRPLFNGTLAKISRQKGEPKWSLATTTGVRARG